MPQDQTKETILQTARLFIRNLAFSCTDADLLELFRPYGEVSQVSHIFFSSFTAYLGRDETSGPRSHIGPSWGTIGTYFSHPPFTLVKPR